VPGATGTWQRACGRGGARCFFARPNLVWVELSKDVVEPATVIRIKHGLRTLDALQAASCLQLGAKHLFLTGDVAFKKVGGLDVKLLT
jgi:predicted nucleic acid-binding protein